MTDFDADAYVASVLAAARAKVRAESVAAVARATAKATQASRKIAKPERARRSLKPPKRPPSEPQHEVTTLLTYSELMALERMAREAGRTPEVVLRWCLQAYAEEVECRRGSTELQLAQLDFVRPPYE